MKIFLICLWLYLSIFCTEALEGLFINASDANFKLQGFKGEITTCLKGSCLIYDLKGDVLWKGRWKKVYAKNGRFIYKGEGDVRIKGEAKVVQFLGCSIKSKIKGTAKIILYPSLLQKGKKNFYRYDRDKENRFFGAFSLETLWLPKRV